MKIFPLHLIPNDTKFDFLRLRWISVGIAALLFVFSIAAIATKGFNFALDFTGGTVVDMQPAGSSAHAGCASAAPSRSLPCGRERTVGALLRLP